MTEANNTDTRVSGTYRDLATETTPPELDSVILKMATDNVRTRYGLARAWVRPVAWAATIGLSFAFILELSQQQDRPAIEAEVLQETPELQAPEELAPRRMPVAQKAVPAPADLETDSAELLQQAEEMTRAKAGLARAAAGFAAQEARADHCDTDARSSADTWYDCIVALRDQGLTEAADRELEALKATYPDFHEPDPGK